MTNNGATVEDRLSELPEAIIHHIMSFLSVVDKIRMCSVSKTLKSCYPMVVFNYGHHPHCDSPNQRTRLRPDIEDYLNHVDSTIQMLKHGNIKLDLFRLQVPNSISTPDSRIHRAISFAMRRGVDEVDIDFGLSEKFYSNYSGLTTCYPLPLHAITCITSCPNPMTTLSLRGLDILGLEELTLSCRNIRILSIQNCVVCQTGGRNNIIKINLPVLQSFEYKGIRNVSYKVNFDLSSCTLLREVSLEKADIDDMWVENQIPRLPKLETLEITDCSLLEYFKISGHAKLKTIDLRGCPRLQSIEIGVIYLESLTYVCHDNSRHYKINIEACVHLKNLTLG